MFEFKFRGNTMTMAMMRTRMEVERRVTRSQLRIPFPPHLPVSIPYPPPPPQPLLPPETIDLWAVLSADHTSAVQCSSAQSVHMDFYSRAIASGFFSIYFFLPSCFFFFSSYFSFSFFFFPFFLFFCILSFFFLPTPLRLPPTSQPANQATNKPNVGMNQGKPMKQTDSSAARANETKRTGIFSTAITRVETPVRNLIGHAQRPSRVVPRHGRQTLLQRVVRSLSRSSLLSSVCPSISIQVVLSFDPFAAIVGLVSSPQSRTPIDCPPGLLVSSPSSDGGVG